MSRDNVSIHQACPQDLFYKTLMTSAGDQIKEDIDVKQSKNTDPFILSLPCGQLLSNTTPNTHKHTDSDLKTQH